MLLFLLGLTISTFAVLYESFYLRPVRNVFTRELFLQMIVAPSIVALVRGFRQVLPELWPDHWAFLVQRGVSTTLVFLASVSAAAIVYGLVMLTALLIAVVCCCWHGIDRFPFQWQMLLAPIGVSIGAFGFYFVVMQCVVRQAGHYVTRILPLTRSGFLIFGVVFIHAEVYEGEVEPAKPHKTLDLLSTEMSRFRLFECLAGIAIPGLSSVTMSTVPSETLQADRLDISRDRRIKFSWTGCILSQHLMDQHLFVAAKRALPGQQLEQNHAQRIDVRCGTNAVALTSCLFR